MWTAVGQNKDKLLEMWIAVGQNKDKLLEMWIAIRQNGTHCQNRNVDS